MKLLNSEKENLNRLDADRRFFANKYKTKLLRRPTPSEIKLQLILKNLLSQSNYELMTEEIIKINGSDNIKINNIQNIIGDRFNSVLKRQYKIDKLNSFKKGLLNKQRNLP